MSDPITITIGDDFHIMLTTVSPTTGQLVNADSLPIWQVRDTSDDSVVFNGNHSLISGKTGEYSANPTYSAANGAVAGTNYRPVSYATVGGFTLPKIHSIVRVIAAATTPTVSPTDVQVVRLLMGDSNSLFTDSEIQIFINEEKVGSVVRTKSAAALALYSVAASKALVEAAKKLLNYSGDNKGMAKNLIAIADKLIAKEIDEPYSVDVEQSGTPFATLDILNARWKEAGF